MKVVTEKIRIYILIILACIFMLSFVGCDNTNDNNPVDPTPPTPPAWSQNYELPKANNVKARLLDIYGKEEAIFLLQTNTINRMKCPTSHDTIKINFTFHVDDYASKLFNDCVEEFNYVFNVINPNYKFEINYNPTQEDLKYYYSVKVSKVASFPSQNTLGTAPLSYLGNGYIGNFGINIKESVLNNGSQIMSVFKHELMHLLGAGDAYKNDYATKDTIMQGYSPNGNFSFSNSDVAFLDAMYRNPENQYSNEYILNFIENYQETNIHNFKQNQSNIYKDVIENLNVDILKSQLDSLGYQKTLVEQVKSCLGTTLTFKPEFANNSLNIGELPYQTPEKDVTVNIYYQFNFQTNKHQFSQKKFGSNMINSSSGASVKVYNFNNGIIICDTNGNVNSVFLIQIDDYVLSLKRTGDFNNLSELGGNVNKLYKITEKSNSAWLDSIYN